MVKHLISESYRTLVSKLTDIYDKREAANIAAIIFEDAFATTDPVNSKKVLTVSEYDILINISNELLLRKPWQYVLGQADFYSLKFLVNENVLIPRPETEELVHTIVKSYKDQSVDILDIGTGSGCIAISLKKHIIDANVCGVDVCEDALGVASKNAILNNTIIDFQQLDISIVNETKKMPFFDIIISNPPYIQLNEKYLMSEQVLMRPFK